MSDKQIWRRVVTNVKSKSIASLLGEMGTCRFGLRLEEASWQYVFSQVVLSFTLAKKVPYFVLWEIKGGGILKKRKKRVYRKTSLRICVLIFWLWIWSKPESSKISMLRKG